MAKKTATATATTSVAPLYGRCLTLTVDGKPIELKVMGDKQVAAETRDFLLTLFGAMGITVTE